VSQEQPSAGEDLQPKRMAEGTRPDGRALRSPLKMTIEPLENRVDRSVKGQTQTVCPLRHMLRRT
jgi:hypothetical protein